MDAQSTLARQVWDRLRARFSRKAVIALAVIALLGICDTAIAHSMPAPYASAGPAAPPRSTPQRAGHIARQITPVAGQPIPTVTMVARPSPTAVVGQQAPVPTAPTVAPQTGVTPLAAAPVPTAPTTKPKPRPTRSATPASIEAQTPLHLSDPTSNDALATDAPWWQTLLDVAWKLALVVGLIYLAMRALAALKGKGFAPGKGVMPRASKNAHHFMEQIEEIQLAPNHVLHAVRVGERVMLIARTNGTLRALGEAEILADDAGTGEAPALPPGNFAGQLMRAWAGLIPPGAVKEDPVAQPATPEVEADDDAAEDSEDEAVIDAKWSPVHPDAALEEATLPELPLRKGTARPVPPPRNMA